MITNARPDSRADLCGDTRRRSGAAACMAPRAPGYRFWGGAPDGGGRLLDWPPLPRSAPCPPRIALNPKLHARPPEGTALHFESALNLLTQSGREAPPGVPGSAEWTQALIDALVELSSRDALTGLANRRAFELALAREVDRVARSGEPALLLALDIDHFKRVNDTYGHPAGDQVIRGTSINVAEAPANAVVATS